METEIRSQRYNDLFLQCLRLGFFLLLEMSLIRFIHFHLARGGLVLVGTEVLLRAFVVGFRFDLLVLGFVFIPVVILGPAVMMAGVQDERVNSMIKTYFTITWSLILAMAFWSLPYFLIKGRHFRFATDGFNFIWPRFDSFTNAVVILIFVFLIISPLKSIWRRHFLVTSDWHRRWSGVGKVQLVLRLLLPLIFATLAARGSVATHHLERADAEFSVWDKVTELALNAAWCFDK